MKPLDVFDIIIIFAILFIFYRLIRKTEAFKIIVGVLIIFALSLIAGELGLELTSALFKKVSSVLIMGLVFILSPELRVVLRKLGEFMNIRTNEGKELIEEIEEAVFSLAEQKIGALIILDHNKRLSYQVDNVVEIDANCTSELLETIFYQNTPLHDGAVLIHNERIAYAGCKLPLSGKRREGLGHLGTRHLAALENSEKFDITAIVVSEETGNVSVVKDGNLYRVKSSKMFRNFFEKKKEFQNKKSKKKIALLSSFPFKKKKEIEK